MCRLQLKRTLDLFCSFLDNLYFFADLFCFFFCIFLHYFFVVGSSCKCKSSVV